MAVSSRGDLTGLRNLTIDKAPTNPRDNAMFPLITCVTPNVTIGSNNKVIVICLDLIHMTW